MLQSIYGEDAVKIWRPSRSGSQSPPDRSGHAANPRAEPGTIRYEVTLRYVRVSACRSASRISSSGVVIVASKMEKGLHIL